MAEPATTPALTHERAYAIMVGVAAQEAWDRLETDLWMAALPLIEARMRVVLTDAVSGWARGEDWSTALRRGLGRYLERMAEDLPSCIALTLTHPAYDLLAVEGTPPYG